jgi:hypothetical protein
MASKGLASATMTALVCGIGLAATARAKCEIGLMAELPVTMQDLRPVVPVQFNGQSARLLAHGGAFYSMITQATAAQFGLKVKLAPPGFYVTGVNGRADVQVATFEAQNGRCWARALLGTDLDKALADCNAAVRSNTKWPPTSTAADSCDCAAASTRKPSRAMTRR